MEDKIYCPILLAECRFELCPYYTEDNAVFMEFSFCWNTNDGGYVIQDGCTNPICERSFNQRKATLTDLERNGIRINPLQRHKYED